MPQTGRTRAGWSWPISRSTSSRPSDRDAISSQLLRYRDVRGDDWADIIDMLTMHPDARRVVASAGWARSRRADLHPTRAASRARRGPAGRNVEGLPSSGRDIIALAMEGGGPFFGDLTEEYLAAIGRVAMTFGVVEGQTALLFEHLLETEEAASVQDEAIKRQIRRIEDLAPQVVEDAEILRSVRRWAPRVRDAADKRNEVLHAIWSRDPDEPFGKLSKFSIGPRHPDREYTIDELTSLRLRSTSLRATRTSWDTTSWTTYSFERSRPSTNRPTLSD